MKAWRISSMAAAIGVWRNHQKTWRRRHQRNGSMAKTSIKRISVT